MGFPICQLQSGQQLDVAEASQISTIRKRLNN